jgi:glutathione peroxidase
MIKFSLVLSLLVVGVLAMNRTSSAADATMSARVKSNSASPLNQSMKSLDGRAVNPAEKYAGKVVLLVNVASFCGNTPQYKPLEALHDKYADQGLAIVGVPCNQFGGQEPGSPKEIATFCSTKYGVEFDLMSKVDVNGENACPLYKWLTSAETNPKSPGPIQWNFEKFLFNRQGELVARFSPKTQPDAPEVVEAIEAQLTTQ